MTPHLCFIDGKILPEKINYLKEIQFIIFTILTFRYFYTWALVYKIVRKTGSSAEMKVRHSVEYKYKLAEDGLSH